MFGAQKIDALKFRYLLISVLSIVRNPEFLVKKRMRLMEMTARFSCVSIPPAVMGPGPGCLSGNGPSMINRPGIKSRGGYIIDHTTHLGNIGCTSFC